MCYILRFLDTMKLIIVPEKMTFKSLKVIGDGTIQ